MDFVQAEMEIADGLLRSKIEDCLRHTIGDGGGVINTWNPPNLTIGTGGLRTIFIGQDKFYICQKHDGEKWGRPELTINAHLKVTMFERETVFGVQQALTRAITVMGLLEGARD